MRAAGANLVRGIGTALLASYVYGVLVWTVFGPFQPLTLLAGVYSVIVTAWFVLPLGAVLGLSLPNAASRLRPSHAAIQGFALGVLCGLLCGLLLSIQLT